LVPRAIWAGVGYLGFCASLWGFFGTGGYYEDFYIPYATGMDYVAPLEWTFFFFYLIWGGLAALFLTFALYYGRAPERVGDWFERAALRPSRYLWMAAITCLGLSLGIYFFILEGAPLSVDDNAYIFAAQTLSRFRLTNPIPPDVNFYDAGLIVTTEQGWWSKFPIGHPLLLAVGELLHARALVVPLVTAACVLALFALARPLVGPKIALCASFLLATSPQFVMTGASSMSQPASTLCLLGALFFYQRGRASMSRRDVFLTGLCLGAGIFVRPFPGLLFAGGLGLFWLIGESAPLKQKLSVFLWAALPLCATGLLMGLINYAQTGSPFVTGYQVAHKTLGILAERGQGFEGIALSIGSALGRFQAWFLGWPIGCLAILFAWKREWAALWLVFLAQLVYRWLAAKTGLSPTGPIYVYEAVPIAVLLTSAGLERIKSLIRPELQEKAQRLIVAGVIAMVTTNFLLFWPIQLKCLRQSADTWNFPYKAVRDITTEPALVFARDMSSAGSGHTWAVRPPVPHPDLNEPIIFAKVPSDKDVAAKAMAFWKTHHPKRRAFSYQFRDDRPFLWEIKSERDVLIPPWKQ
jgi:hypothetical protein